MPDTLNKQTLINLLIDSPLREPIKINLIDIVNNTNEPDLPKVYSTITKELEIFQKATERRMKLADETIAKLGGVSPTEPVGATVPAPAPMADPLPQPPAPPTALVNLEPVAPSAPSLSVPPLDLPPLPTSPTTPTIPDEHTLPTPTATPNPTPSFQPLGSTPMAASSDEDALAEIQKELDSLKTEAAADVASAAAPAAPVAPPVPPIQQ